MENLVDVTIIWHMEMDALRAHQDMTKRLVWDLFLPLKKIPKWEYISISSFMQMHARNSRRREHVWIPVDRVCNIL